MTDSTNHPNLRLFVAPSGSDGNPGSEREPLATLAGARDRIRELRREGTLGEPVSVAVADGHYLLDTPLVFSPEDSGQVRFKATGDHAVIDGGVRLNGWTETEHRGRRAWIADLPDAVETGWVPRCLWADGVRRPRARFPKFSLDEQGRERLLRIGDYRFRGEKNKLRGGDVMFKPRPGDIDPDWQGLYDAEAVVLHFWIEDRLPQLHYDPETGWLESGRRSTFLLSEAFGPEPAPYYLDNLSDALTEPGEWVYHPRSGRLTYLPMEHEQVDEIEIIAPRPSTLLRIRGGGYNRRKSHGAPPFSEPVADLRFEGITFRHTNWHQPGAEFLAVDNLSGAERPLAAAVQAAAHAPSAVELDTTRSCAFTDCRFERLGATALDIGPGCRDIHVTGCRFRDLGGGAVRIGGAELDEDAEKRTGYCTVTDNDIRGCGRVFHSAVGILVTTACENIIAHNHIEDLFYTAISVGWSWGYKETATRDNLILRNRIRKVGQGLLSDLGAVYLLGVQPGTVVEGNHISDLALRRYGGWGLYLDEGASHIRVENNFVHDVQGPPLNIHFGRDNLVRRNLLVASPASAAVSVGRTEPHAALHLTGNLLVAPGAHVYEGGYRGEPRDSLRAEGNVIAHGPDTRAAGFVHYRDNPPLSIREWTGPDHDRHSVWTADLPDWDPETDPEGAALARALDPDFQPAWLQAGPRPPDERNPLRQPLTRKEREV